MLKCGGGNRINVKIDKQDMQAAMISDCAGFSLKTIAHKSGNTNEMRIS
jgi:hypothetical protein